MEYFIVKIENNMKIALVNDSDEIIGYEDKMTVHENGLLHRAFSIVIFNNHNQVLLHKRAEDKYHSGSLWTNACCSHLPEKVEFEEYIHERLIDEMGFDCNLKFYDKLRYYTEFNNNMFEHEIDHIYLGIFDGEVKPNPSEASDYRWMEFSELIADIQANPEKYTVWFNLIINKLNSENERFKELITLLK